MILTKNPKDNPEWHSNKYRRFIRDHLKCMTCDIELLIEKPEYITHHHHHSGGKHPRDQLLVPLCLACHNKYHAGAKHMQQITEEMWLGKITDTLVQYVLSLNLNPWWVMINALSEVAQENSG